MDTRSEVTTDLDAAMLRARIAMKPINKNANNPFFNSKFSDLGDDVLPTINEAAMAQGILTTHPTWCDDSGVLHVACEVTHAASGQWRRAEMIPILPPNNAAPETTDQYGSKKKSSSPNQLLGSAITYVKRYVTLAVWGVHPVNEDDDGSGGAQPDRGGDGGTGDRPAARARPSSRRPVAAAPEGSVGAGLTDPQALAKGFADVLALSRRVKDGAKAAGEEAACRNDLMAVFVGTDKANPRYVWEGNPTTSFRRGDGKDVTIADVTRLVAEFIKIGKRYGVSS